MGEEEREKKAEKGNEKKRVGFIFPCFSSE